MLRSILLHTDGSPVAEHVARYGRVLGEAFGASVHILHSSGEPLSAGWTSEVHGARLPEVHEAMEAEARQRFGAIFTDAVQQRLRLRLTIETGGAADALVRYVEAHAIDLLVMGARREGPEEAGLDDLARDVASRVPCSVLIVRPPGRR